MKAAHFLLILGVSMVLALYSAWSRQEPKAGLAGDATAAGIPLIRVEEAHRLWQEPGTLFLDVRSEPDFVIGHVPGAVHLREEDFEVGFPALRERLAQATTIVVYCRSRDCGKSLWAAIRLRNEGLSRTIIFPEGWNAWISNGLPVSGTN